MAFRLVLVRASKVFGATLVIHTFGEKLGVSMYLALSVRRGTCSFDDGHTREDAPDARGWRVGVQEGHDGVILDLSIKMRGPTKLEEGSGMAGLELLLLVGTRDDEVKKVCSGA